MSPKLLLLSGIGDSGTLAKIGIPLQYHNPAVGRSLADGVYAIMQWATRRNNFVRCRLESQWATQNGLLEDAVDGLSGDSYSSLASSPPLASTERAPTTADEPHQPFCVAQREAYVNGKRASTSFGTPGMSAGAFLRSPYATGPEPDVQLTIHPWDKCARPIPAAMTKLAPRKPMGSHSMPVLSSLMPAPCEQTAALCPLLPLVERVGTRAPGATSSGVLLPSRSQITTQSLGDM